MQEEEFFDLLQRKAATEIQHWVGANLRDPKVAELLLALPGLSGSMAILDKARKLFAAVPAAVEAVDQLQQVAEVVAQRYPAAELYRPSAGTGLPTI